MARPVTAPPGAEETRFRSIFRKAHAGHAACRSDEWSSAPCADQRTGDARPLVWSRRNGPWHQVDLLFVGAAPGNAGGRGSGPLGAHATRIPFGGDVAGANLDVLLAAAGLTRNDVFLSAAYNRLPAKGGGEPTRAELLAPVGDYASSLHLVRDVMLAAGPKLLVALGIAGLRALLAAAVIDEQVRLPTTARIQAAGLERGIATPWPSALQPDDAFRSQWRAWWNRELPHLLWLTHPSAQNMSPYAGVETLFHTRMLEARDALLRAVRAVLRRRVPDVRPAIPRAGGIYDLREWRELVGPRHEALEARWREKGV